MGKPARFMVEGIVLRDLGPWEKHYTITNDAENVVERLFEEGDLKVGQRLFYWDSGGDLTEIVIKDMKFAGFKDVKC